MTNRVAQLKLPSRGYGGASEIALVWKYGKRKRHVDRMNADHFEGNHAYEQPGN